MSCASKTTKVYLVWFVKMPLTLQTISFVRRYGRYYFHQYISVLWTILIRNSFYLIRNSFYSVMNDNNEFVTFFFMVLFGNYRLLFWSFKNSLDQKNNLWFRNKTMKKNVLHSHYSLKSKQCSLFCWQTLKKGAKKIRDPVTLLKYLISYVKESVITLCQKWVWP